MGWLLLLLLLVPPAPAHALSWRLPGRATPTSPRPAGDNGRRQLQEVPPPAWVQKARLALEDRNPTVNILAPADGELLPDGPWTLRLRVDDWPLVDGGPLGLGTHLVVQLDGEPPRPTVDTTLAMPPLTPGSHLLTVYAAKPWGEAHKSPLALRQIRLHRLAPNPATLPAPHSPQLIPVSPIGPAGSPPLLFDWLLIDAPLQGLRADTTGWRLRLTVNGESVLLDQQTPLWLQGWTPGGNALLMELLDGRGEPLNPPFNSLLREVNVPATGAGRSPNAPLSDLELAVLLGDQPVSVLAPPLAEPSPSSGRSLAPEGSAEGATVAPTEPLAAAEQPVGTTGPAAAAPAAGATESAAAGKPMATGELAGAEGSGAAAESETAAALEVAKAREPVTPEMPVASGSPEAGEAAVVFETPSSSGQPAQPTAAGSGQAAPAAEAPAKVPQRAEESTLINKDVQQTEPPPAANDTPTFPPPRTRPSLTDTPTLPDLPAVPDATAPPAAPARPKASDPSEAPTTSETPTPPANAAIPPTPPPPDDASLPAREPAPSPTTVITSARAEVNPDGTLRRPSRSGPLERLRERLGR